MGAELRPDHTFGVFVEMLGLRENSPGSIRIDDSAGTERADQLNYIALDWVFMLG